MLSLAAGSWSDCGMTIGILESLMLFKKPLNFSLLTFSSLIKSNQESNAIQFTDELILSIEKIVHFPLKFGDRLIDADESEYSFLETIPFLCFKCLKYGFCIHLFQGMSVLLTVCQIILYRMVSNLIRVQSTCLN